MQDVIKNNIEDIYAIGRLYEFCSSKRFQLLKNEFLYDEIGLKALAINNLIKNKNGVDIFQATSENDLINYEKILNQFISNYSDDIFGPVNLGDEMVLLELKEDFSLERISEFKIGMDSGLKSSIKRYNLIFQDVVNYCKSANKISYVEECGSFFLTKAVKIKNKDKIILIHLTIDSSTTPSIDSKNTHLRFLDPKSALSYKTLKIQMFFVFEFDEVEDILYNPIRLFIRWIDMHAVVIPLNNSLKKFYYKELLPAYINLATLNSYFDDLIGNKLIRSQIKFVSLIKNSAIQLKFEFLYGFYIKDI